MIQFRELLRLLVEGQLDFVIVGGLAATIHGVAEPTRDLDVCIVPSRETWSRVADIIRPLNPRYALTPDKRPIGATADELEAVARNATTVDIDGLKVRVISVDDLITVKEHVRRPKDLEVAAELRAIRDALRSP